MIKKQATTIFKDNKRIDLTQRIRKGIQMADIYGAPVQLQLKKGDFHQTMYGGIFTVVTIAISALFFWQRFMEMVNREAPSTLSSTLFSSDPPRFEMSQDKFFFAFGMQDFFTFQNYIDQTIYKADFQSCIKRTILNTTSGKYYDDYKCTSMPWERCNNKKHIVIPEIQDFFKKRESYINQLFCIPLEYLKSTPPAIEGTFDNNFFQWISIKVYQCVNSTENNNSCKTQEEIESRLNKGFFEVYFTDSIADYSQADSPYQIVARTIFDSFSLQYAKEYDMFFRNLHTDSDEGLLLTDFKNYKSIQLSQSYNYITFDAPSAQDPFLNTVIRLETKLDYTKRTYSKIQDLMGVVGGFWKVFTIIGVILVSPINKLDMQISVINSLFNFEVMKDKRRSSNKNSAEDEEIPSQNDGKVISKPSSPRDKLNKKQVSLQSNDNLPTKLYDVLRQYVVNKDGGHRASSATVNQFLKLKIGKIKLQTSEYIWFFVSCLKNLKAQRNQIKFAIEKYEKDIDLIHLLRRITEIEKLKMLILSQNQLQLFDYLPRPCIPMESEGYQIQQRYDELLSQSLDKKMKFWQTLQTRKTHKQRALEAYQAYGKLQQSKQISKLDQKLILFLDPNIRELFRLLHKQDMQDQEREQPPLYDEKMIELQNKELDVEDEIGIDCYSDRSIQKFEQTGAPKTFMI